MNAKFELEIADQNIVVSAFRTPGGTAELFERIAQEVRSQVFDVANEKDREAMGSLALKVSKSKTFIEKCGKDLVAEQKAQVKLIDDDRIAIVKKFDDLRNEILAPRDAWKQAEKDRVEKHKANIEKIQDFAHPSILFDMSAIRISEQIRMLDVLEICSLFEEFEEQAKIAKYETLEVLRTALTNREKYEAEQAELERLRQAEQVRIQQERDAQIAREATEKAQREAEEKARFEAERVQREKAESEQREARLKAEKEAAELREQALKQKAIDDAKQAEIAKQQAIEAERKRIEAEQFAQAEYERKALEAREADQAHKKIICGEALKGLTDLGVDEDLGKEILRAINKGLVPHVSIKF